MYQIVSVLNGFIREEMMPNPFEFIFDNPIIVLIFTSLIGSKILKNLAYSMCGIFYNKGDAPILGSILYMIFWRLNVFSIANIAILLIYNFENSRYFIKNIIVAVLNEEVAININNIYLMILSSLKWLIYIYIIFILVVVIYKMIKYYINRFKQRKEAMQASGINKDLYDYLNDYDKKCFVITGDWGVGKTYTVDNFFDRYFK